MNIKKVKLEIIENFIDSIAASSTVKSSLKIQAKNYVANDVNCEIDSLIEPVKKVLTSLATDAKMALTGEWDCTTSEGLESFKDQLTLIDTLGLIEVKMAYDEIENSTDTLTV